MKKIILLISVVFLFFSCKKNIVNIPKSKYHIEIWDRTNSIQLLLINDNIIKFDTVYVSSSKFYLLSEDFYLKNNEILNINLNFIKNLNNIQTSLKVFRNDVMINYFSLYRSDKIEINKYNYNIIFNPIIKNWFIRFYTEIISPESAELTINDKGNLYDEILLDGVGFIDTTFNINKKDVIYNNLDYITYACGSEVGLIYKVYLDNNIIEQDYIYNHRKISGIHIYHHYVMWYY